MVKKRTLNELRQTKDSVYENKQTKEVKINPTKIIELIKKYPNDYDLGNAVRNYFLNTKKVIND